MIWKSCALIASLALVLTSLGHAAVIQVQSDIADYEAIKTVSSSALSTSNGVGGDNRIGSRTSSTLASSILGFELPAVAPGDITSATLTVTFEGESASLSIQPGDGNIDLYGLPIESGNFSQLASRYFSGPTDATAGVTKLQDNFFTVAEYPAESTAVTKVSVDISSYLQSLYTGGALPGDFAVLRLSYDIDALSGNNRYRLVTSGGDGSTVDSQPHTIAEGAPHLTITVIPEPGCLALVVTAGIGIAARRRQLR
jgi:hypothetical protein